MYPYLYVSLSVCVSLYLYLSVSVCLSICISIYLYISLYLSIYPSICLSVCLSIDRFFYLFIYLPIYLPICLPSLSLCLYIYVYFDICTYAHSFLVNIEVLISTDRREPNPILHHSIHVLHFVYFCFVQLRYRFAKHAAVPKQILHFAYAHHEKIMTGHTQVCRVRRVRLVLHIVAWLHRNNHPLPLLANT